MKEVTEWNGKPRYMWCWDYDENYRVKDYVVCILSEEEMKETGTNWLVRALCNGYMHCAEIEEETRLTDYELSQLLKCLGVDYTWGCMTSCHNSINPTLVKEGEKIPEDYKIRYKQGEWEKPTKETVLKWWCREGSDSDISRFVSFFGWGEDKE